MNIRLICDQCGREQGLGVVFMETIRDDGLYKVKCPVGHSLLIVTQTLRHEMLFEIALNAIRDRYYREAVSSFAASVERFYEFAIRVFALEDAVPKEVMGQAWKPVSRLSERQYGAYLLLYTCHFHKVPSQLSNSMIEFRNKVIHQGVLPSEEEVKKFGEVIYRIIQDGVIMLRSKYPKKVEEQLVRHVSSIADKMGATYPRSFMSTPTALNITEAFKSTYRPFQELLKA